MSTKLNFKNFLVDKGWYTALADELQAPYFKEIEQKIDQEIKQGIIVYPLLKEIFNAFNKTPFHNVRVVILGQDPYHREGLAHGLSFSVPQGVAPPPSLINIFKELKNDLDIEIPKNRGDLSGWAEQGVFLLNTILTVRAHAPASHHHIGWEEFTDAVIKTLSDTHEHLVFILWGKYAEQKRNLIDAGKHLVIVSAHPSPFSARKFFGGKYFSKTNEYLRAHHKKEIAWVKI